MRTKMAKCFKTVRVPSIKRLIAENIVNTEEQAENLRVLLKCGDIKEAVSYLRNDMGWCCGLEAMCFPEGAWNNCQTPRHTLEYFNAGDPYVSTLLRVDGKDNWFIGCVGDTQTHLERH